MIHYVKGNLFESTARALVNTVNTVGVMGKGIALQFREAFPENYRIYRNVCLKKELNVGQMLVVTDSNSLIGTKTIINFPTKTHWRLPSEYSYIERGLKSLRQEIIDRKIDSIAVPPLGSHNGGLDWNQVKPMVESALSDLDCDVYIYEPSQEIIDKLKSERVKLTPARAMLLTMFKDMIGSGEFASVFAAEKLIYFLQRFGAKDIFKIDFKPYYYGPYSGGKVAHMLYALNGSYIQGMGGMGARPFDNIWLLKDAGMEAWRYLDSLPDSQTLRNICNNAQAFLQDYYSNYSLELLSSVDYLLNTVTSLQNWRHESDDYVLDTLTDAISRWSKRKEQIFNKSHLADAYHYLAGQDTLWQA